MRVLLVGHDRSPKESFEPLAAALSAANYEVISVLGKDFPPEHAAAITDRAPGVDLVLVGMSSDPQASAKEIFALQAARANGIRYGFLSDTPGCYGGRDWFASYKPAASLLLVSSGYEVSAAQKMYPKAHVVAVGHPKREAGNVPALTREAVRAHLGIKANEIMLIAAGTKMEPVNVELLTIAGLAIDQLRGSNVPYRVVFCPHPSDEAAENDWAACRVTYSDLTFAPPPPKGLYRSLDLLLGADAVLNSLSSLHLECAHNSIPSICVIGSTIADARKKEFGRIEPIQAEDGSMVVANNADELAALLRRLSSTDGFADMKRAQRDFYPPQPAGTSVRLMVEAIEHFKK